MANDGNDVEVRVNSRSIVIVTDPDDRECQLTLTIPQAEALRAKLPAALADAAEMGLAAVQAKLADLEREAAALQRTIRENRPREQPDHDKCPF